MSAQPRPDSGVRVRSARVIEVLARVVERCLDIDWLENHDRRVWVLAKQILLLHEQIAVPRRRNTFRGVTAFISFGVFRGVHRAAHGYARECRELLRLRVDADPMRARWRQVHEGSSDDATDLGDLLSERLIALTEHVLELQPEPCPHRQEICTRIVGWGMLLPFAQALQVLRRYIAEKAVTKARWSLVRYYENIVRTDVINRSQRYGARYSPDGALNKCLS